MEAFLNIERIECSAEEYFLRPEVSNTEIGLFLEHPRKFLDKPERDTDALRLGAAIDCFILTPDEFDGRYAVMSEDLARPTTDMQTLFVQCLMEGRSEDEALHVAGYKKRTVKREDFGEYIGFVEASDGKDIIPSADMALIRALSNAVAGHEYAKKILSQSEKQAVFVATHYTGIKCKCMVDILLPNGELLDLKSTRADSPRSFRYQVLDLGYDRQLGLYQGVSGGEALGWMALMKPTAECRLFEGGDFVAEGARKANVALERLAWHMDHDEWDHHYDYYHNEGWERM